MGLVKPTISSELFLLAFALMAFTALVKGLLLLLCLLGLSGLRLGCPLNSGLLYPLLLLHWCLQLLLQLLFRGLFWLWLCLLTTFALTIVALVGPSGALVGGSLIGCQHGAVPVNVTICLTLLDFTTLSKLEPHICATAADRVYRQF